MTIEPVSRHKGRQFALAMAAVLATVAVVAGLILGTFGFVRTSQLADSNARNIARQCEALQVTIAGQRRGLRDGLELFGDLRAKHPKAFDKLVRESRRDLRKLSQISRRLHCRAVKPGQKVRLSTDVQSGGHGRGHKIASAGGAGGGTTGTTPRTQPGPRKRGPQGSPGPTGPPGTPGVTPTPQPSGGILPRATDSLCRVTPAVCQLSAPLH